MKVLVVGLDGRTDALIAKLGESPLVTELHCAPGNPGTGRRRKNKNVPIAVTDILGLRDYALANKIGFTVVSPELPLSLGITDAFAACDPPLLIFGPTRAAAQLETSKAFAKRFMWAEGIPTADAEICYTADSAEKFAEEHDYERPLVVKADGLAAGKGVTVCRTFAQAQQAIALAMRQRVFGPAGDCVLLEQFLNGEEASFHVLVDGENVLPLAVTQDHKRIYDGDLGPNTGGMGAYSPAPVITPEIHGEVVRRIVRPTVTGMAARGTPYRGALYVGLMIVEGRPHVIEFNARFGDPETQPLLVRLHNDLLPLLEGAARGNLRGLHTEYRNDASVCVVMAAPGYPGKPTVGSPIIGVEEVERMEDTWVFHAGTAVKNMQLVTSGGRVLGVTTRAATLASAIAQAYRAVEHIEWPGAHYRRDIGYRALHRDR
jgi:phosphoribosylamine--glycine ligase